MWREHDTGQRYDTQIEAARAHAAQREMKLDAFKYEKARLPVRTIDDQQAEMIDFLGLYAFCYPGDAVDADKRSGSKRCWAAIEAHCGIVPSLFLAKYDVHRDCVEEATLIIDAREAKRKGKARSAEAILYDILMLAAQKISKHVWPKCWEESVGCGNFHWMIFHNMLQLLGMLSLKPPSETAKGMSFCNSGTLYYPVPINEAIKQGLRTHIAFGQGCLALADSPPQTGQEYMDGFWRIDEKSGRSVAARSRKGYTRKWIKRGFLRLLMQSYGMRLDVKGMRVRDYIECFPDEHKRLVPLLTDVNQSLHQNLGMLVSDALKNLQYRDDADLLSTHACLLDNYEVQCILRSKPQGWCKRNRKVLKAAMEEYFGKHGIYPHPVVPFKKYAHLP